MLSTIKHNAPFEKIGNVECVPTSSLTLPKRSLRNYKRPLIRKFARCVEALGILVPILVDENGVIISGTPWFLAACHLELPEVRVIRVTHLSNDQILAYRVAEQRLAELAPWNDAELAETLKELSEVDLNFDIEIIGFSLGEISSRIDSLFHTPSDVLDEVPRIHAKAATRIGDLWCLGPHRLLCGSSLDPASWSALMAGKTADLVFTDPPYNVAIDGHVGGKGETKHREFAMASGEMKPAEFLTFLKTVTRLLKEHSSDGSLHYICIDWRHIKDLIEAGECVYTKLINICVWKKHNGGMGSFYRSQHELVVVFKNGKRPHRNNIELGRHKRNRTNVWEYAGANSFSGRKTEEGNLLELHPTVKPVQLIADVILDSTARGAIVVDAFMGSGSSLLAAERVGRKIYGIEIDPLYVDVAIRRWQRLTGRTATLMATGQSFAELEEVREVA